jgi:hypothetical protein
MHVPIFDELAHLPDPLRATITGGNLSRLMGLPAEVSA